MITFIGGGNMGEAFISALCEKKVFLPQEILVIGRNTERLGFLAQKYGIRTSKKIEDSRNSKIIFLAVKPQNLADLPILDFSGKIVISILAGAKITKISEKFQNAKIVRTMPNLGQLVNFGMTGIFFEKSQKFSQSEKELVNRIFESSGKCLEVQNEEDLDKITAISGSGPAYFFYFVENLWKSAIRLGFDEKSTETLARQTFLGSAEILKQNEADSPTLWRERVTSKGGTTEAAIKNFENSNFESIFWESIQKAKERAEELGN